MHISGHSSATKGRVQDGKRMLSRDWLSTAEPRGPSDIKFYKLNKNYHSRLFVMLFFIILKQHKNIHKITHNASD